MIHVLFCEGRVDVRRTLGSLASASTWLLIPEDKPALFCSRWIATSSASTDEEFPDMMSNGSSGRQDLADTPETVLDLTHFTEVQLKEETTTIDEKSEEASNEVARKKRVTFSSSPKRKEQMSETSLCPPKTKSSNSQVACRYCFEPSGHLISPCKCSGSQSYVHVNCMKEWIEKSSQEKCGICRTHVHGFKSRKHILYYASEVFIVVAVIGLVVLYFGTNHLITNCRRSLPVEHCSPIVITAAAITHFLSPVLLFTIFWLSTFFIKFKVMVTVYDPDKSDSGKQLINGDGEAKSRPT